MDSEHITAIITGAAAILGGLAVAIFSAIQELISNYIKRKKSTAHLAVIVVPQLELFAEQCANVAYDDGTLYGRPAGEGGAHRPTTKAPEFMPSEFSVEWTSISKKTWFSIFQLPQTKRAIDNSLNSILEFVAGPPDYKEYFWERRIRYGNLSLDASRLAMKLRADVGMEDKKNNIEDIYQKQQLHDLIERLKTERESYQKRCSELTPGPGF
ncbi:hypothetical protein ACHFCA_52940 (plasmid) [Delftia tsuruhatensis]